MNPRFQKFIGTAFIFQMFIFNACDCGPGVTSIQPQVELQDDAGASHLSEDPWLVIDFGDVNENESANQNIHIKSTGNRPLVVDEVCFVNAESLEQALLPEPPCFFGDSGFSFSNPISQTPEGPGTLEIFASEEVIVPVTFAPTQGGPQALFFRVKSDAVDSPVAAVQVAGRGSAGRLCADNAVIDFGSVFVNDSATQQVRLENCGLQPVTIDSYLVLQNPDDVFTILLDGSEPTAPINVAPGEEIVLEITFAPTQVRSYRDTLAGQVQLSTALPFAANYTLLLLGDAANPPTCRANIVPEVMQFGAVAGGEVGTQQLIIQSAGECACTVTAIDGPEGSPNFSIPNMPALPLVLKGTRGCEGDPEGADQAEPNILIPVEYQAPNVNVAAIENATIDVTTTDAETPNTTVQLEANGGGLPVCDLQINELSPQLIEGRNGIINFGRVTVFFEKKNPIEFTNVGNSPCQITNVQYNVENNTLRNEFGLEYEDGTTLNPSSFSPITIGPNNTVTIFATFSPTDTIEGGIGSIFSFGSYRGEILDATFCAILGRDSCNGVDITTTNATYSFGFEATPVEPAIDILPGEIDFGLVTLGCGSPLRRVTIYNTGSGDLEIGEPRAEPVTNPATFEVSTPGNFAGGATVVLAPGSSFPVDVRYRANTLGVTTGELIIPTYEGGQEGPPVSIPLSGEGTTEREQTDIFDQLDDPTVDVLWVIDDSGSMQPFQDQLADNFDEFFVASNVNNSDFHIGVTTTLAFDECFDISNSTNCDENDQAGYYTACNGNDRYLERSSVDAEGQFTCNVRVANDGNVNPSRDGSDSAEAGLQAARRFLERPRIDDPAINGGFLRDEASLHVIIVSDEPDQSQGPVDLYVDFFRNLKGFRNESLVAVSAIAGPCSQGDVSASGDGRYEAVVDALGGRFQSICDSDWTTMMTNLGLDSLGLKVEYFLSRAADPATLSVCVRPGDATATCNPVPQTAEGQSAGYFYDPVSNSIVFNPNAVPSRGSRIEVHYESACF